MLRRSLFPAMILITVCGGLAVALSTRAREARPRQDELKAQAPRVLPGIQPGGKVQLPNQWSLQPAGKHLLVGDFPVNMTLHPGGEFLAILHAGYSEHEIIVLDLRNKRQRIACRVPLEQTFYGICFSPDGKTLFANGAEFEVVHLFAFADGLLSRPRQVAVAALKDKFIPAGVAVSADGKTLFAAGTWGDAVASVPLDETTKRKTIALEKGAYPYACLPEPSGKRLFVSQWGKSSVAVIDLATARITSWPTESHPTEMALSPDGKTLFVSCSNSTAVSVLDVAQEGKPLETINCALFPAAPSGNTPSSLSLTPDGKLLFVANADNNNLAVFNVEKPGDAKPMGFIPTGWYPTSVRYNPTDMKLYVANGKGLLSRPNPMGPHPYQNPNLRPLYQYIGSLMQGTVSVIDMPDPEQLAKYTKQAYACSPLNKDATVTTARPEGNPIPDKIGEPSPIKYVLYVIKENRTYDQVFGDIKEGNGDERLCLFGAKVTPNHHKLARQFVLLDNLYCDGEVSADGHQWSMGAYATDFVEKVWPLTYRGSPLKKLSTYPSEGNYDSIAKPAGGYIWDRCNEAKVSVRSYGEWIDGGIKPGEPAKARSDGLVGKFDPEFHGYDLNYPDQKRADRFISELNRFEKAGDMPRLQILRLGNDHTAGTKVGSPTPTAYVADNDLALGRVVEAVSQSKFWKETAIFVIEDDAQNGPDHVDAHRTVALVISPYTKRGAVDSTMYSTSSMLRTMELILGLKPMSQFDAAAAPMYHSFQKTADVSGYTHIVPAVDLTEKNKATAFGAKWSESINLTKEDQEDDLEFNEVIWRSVKGANSPMPAPQRAAFVMPR